MMHRHGNVDKEGRGEVRTGSADTDVGGTLMESSRKATFTHELKTEKNDSGLKTCIKILSLYSSC